MDVSASAWRRSSISLGSCGTGAEKPECGEMEPLSGKDAQELGAGLYSSQRDYLEQLEAYRAFRGVQEKKKP